MVDLTVILRLRSLWSVASVAISFCLPFFRRIFIRSMPFILLSSVNPKYVGFECRISDWLMKMRGFLGVLSAMTSVFR